MRHFIWHFEGTEKVLVSTTDLVLDRPVDSHLISIIEIYGGLILFLYFCETMGWFGSHCWSPAISAGPKLALHSVSGLHCVHCSTVCALLVLWTEARTAQCTLFHTVYIVGTIFVV